MTSSTGFQKEASGTVSPAHAPQVAALDPAILHAAAQEFLALLSERSRGILVERFGLTNGRPKTLVDIGRREGVSRERIRQIVETALNTVRAGAAPAGTARERARNALVSLCTSFGGVATEELILASAGSAGDKEQSALQFLFASFPEFSEARETQRTKAHWIMTSPSTSRSEDGEGALAKSSTSAGPSLETVLEAGERILEERETLVPETEYLGEIRDTLGIPVADTVLRAYLSVSKRIVRNPFGNFGLRTSREAVPRSVGDKGYLVLKAHGQPRHFRAIADEINRAGFDRKRALAETVHNDLIRDSRFVLVGRGTYALREWGFTPGRVSEVIVRLLREAGRPLQKSEIVAEVLKQRFVKRNTVLLCLLNRSLFQAGPDGTYTLVERGAEPPRSLAAAP